MSRSRVPISWPALVVAGIALVLAGAGITYFTVRPSPATSSQRASATGAPQSGAGAPPPAPGVTSPDVVVTLTPEAIARAGIVLAKVSTGRGTSALRLPGTVEANAYKQVAVTPLVGGRVTRVLAELGQPVRRGQPLAEIFSPELAEAETRFVSTRAELDAHERELQRTEKLVEIGSASRQEMERLHAEHTAKLTEVESARSRLELLGLTPSAIASLGPGKNVGATTTVFAPIAGIVAERAVNTGLNVDTTVKLFTVVDLSTVWVVGDLYEKDFSKVRVGANASVTTKAFPDTTLGGRVSYIDPRVNPETRTVKVRVELANPKQELRLGMFADVSIDAPSEGLAALIPYDAVQNVGNRTVVYVADPEQAGRFSEREVQLGDRSGNDVFVLSGAEPGETVVAAGSFNVRAERDRLGLRSSDAASSRTNASARSEPSAISPGIKNVKVIVNETGFEPANISVRAGEPLHLTFVRTTDKTCAKEVVFPSLHIRRALPLNQSVVVDFTPKSSGEIGFECGMSMLRGTVVAQ